VSPVKYELGFYIPEDAILHSHSRENLKRYKSMVSGIHQGFPGEYMSSPYKPRPSPLDINTV
jgi:hypothetical protein